MRIGRALRVDDGEAFDRLFEREYARVVRVAHRVLDDRAAAEDVAQEVFLSFHRSHPATAELAAGWLHSAAAHTALNALRSRKRRASREERGASLDSVADPEGEALASERRAEVREALARMPAKGATLLVLRYSGLSYAECATALGIKADQVGTLLRRAEAAFKKEVGLDG
ncbi:MAG: sigma-70 family RNA polymerase sigma factor [Chloroflexi bacterium]|nr:sigma-70 family RNA polymerase sigma factor [Chloroflexota bacterium]